LFDSEGVLFAWAIGKALLIVIVSVGALVYFAWVTNPEEGDRRACRYPRKWSFEVKCRRSEQGAAH
jgi:hypothetical protein